MQRNLINGDANSFISRKNDKVIFLFIGLALWFISPILGVFALLYFVHLNKKENSRLNLLIILVVVITLTVFVSSVDIISDLAVYVDNYELLGKETPFEVSGGGGFEFVMWLLSYPIYLVSGGSRYAFVFFWSLAINLATFFVIVKAFSPKNYALLALFIVSTPNFIGYQAFLLRQYIATVIFLIALIFIDKKVWMWGLYLLSILTHIGNILYLPILLLYEKVKILESKVTVFLIVLFGITAAFSTSIIFDLSSFIAKFLPSPYSSIILIKTYRYGRQQVQSEDLGIAFVEQVIVFLIIIFLVNNKVVKNPQEKVLKFLYPIFLAIMLMGRNIFLFSNRFAFIFFPFGGLFYYFIIEHKLKIFKKEIIIYLLLAKIAYFIYFMNIMNDGKTVLTFMHGNTLGSNLFDYIEIVYDGFTEDVKIKELPDRIII
jgi:heme/copper-type cytochrome/quinol oxidase subunit 4